MLWYTVVFTIVMLFSASAILLAAEGRYGSGGKAAPEELLEALKTVKGTLEEEQGSWKLDTGKTAYLLHFGNWAYLAGIGIPLEKGKAITVEGSVFDADIVVFNASMEGKTYAFRDKNGVPLWAKYGTDRRGPSYGDWGYGRRGHGYGYRGYCGRGPGYGDWDYGGRGHGYGYRGCGGQRPGDDWGWEGRGGRSSCGGYGPAWRDRGEDCYRWRER
jgi:hypothetical protein